MRHGVASWCVPVFALAAISAVAGEEPHRFKPGDVVLTVYSPTIGSSGWRRSEQYLAVVKECRAIELAAGVSEYRFTDVSEHIDAATVRFVDLTDLLGTRILEQNYHYDLFGQASLLKRFLERPVEFYDARGTRHSGTLLSSSGPLILRGKRQAIEVIGYNREGAYAFRLAGVPADLVTRPTLVWTIRARKAGKHNVLVSYQTGGITWRADYAAVVKAKDTRMDISGWVTLGNACGVRFANARVKLFAGHVRRIRTEQDQQQRGFSDDPGTEGRALPGEKSFFEYHLYALQQPITLANRQIKQVELTAANDIPVKKTYTYDGLVRTRRWDRWTRHDESYGTRCRKTVRVNLEFENTKAANLGIPLPAGVVRAYKRDEADGALEFIGEDTLAHMPRGETARLYFGDAFDLLGDRKRTHFQRPTRGQIRERFEIELRNHKTQPVTIHVLEHLHRGANWKIEESSHKWRKIDAETIEFAVAVPPNGKAEVTYTVFYWRPF